MSGILILIGITTSGPVFLISLAGAVVLYGLILKLYLQTAQDLKRLEGISKFVCVRVSSLTCTPRENLSPRRISFNKVKSLSFVIESLLSLMTSPSLAFEI